MKNEARKAARMLRTGRTVLGALTILLVLVLAVAGCGEAATATPEAAEPTAAPQPTPTSPPSDAGTSDPEPAATSTPESSEPDAPTAVPPTAAPPTALPPTPEPTLRARSEWTPDNPATLEEIEAELEKYRGSTVLMRHAGGAYGGALRQAYLDPLEKKFGLSIIEDSPSPTIAEIRTLAETENIKWHLIDFGTARAVALAAVDALGEYDPAVVDSRDFLGAVTETGPYLAGGGTTWAVVMAYNTDVFPGDSGPKNWADFFDLEGFPGRRALYSYVSYGAQIQLQRLAREPDLLNSPEGRQEVATPSRQQMEEDFAWFDGWVESAGSDIIYWQTGSQCPELLIGGEVTMCTTWNGRIFDAQREGAPVAICWECGFMTGTSGWNISKHLKEQDPEAYELANLVMAWASFPENNVRISQYITYGPANVKSLTFMDDPAYDEVRDELPTSASNIAYSIFFDEAWLAENIAWAEEQYIVATQ